MKIKAEHRVDASEADGDGMYEYYYAYTDFDVTDEGFSAGFRIYDHDRSTLVVRWISDGTDRKIAKWVEASGVTLLPCKSGSLERALAYFSTEHGVGLTEAYDEITGAYSAKPLSEVLAT